MSSGGFLATHVAPADGLQAWDEPDPERPVVAQVQPGVRMQLMEQRGAWGRVLFSNGWSGWVDARRLVAVPAPAPPQAAPQFRPTPPPVVLQQPAVPELADDADPFQLPAQPTSEAFSAAFSDAGATDWTVEPGPEQPRAQPQRPERSEEDDGPRQTRAAAAMSSLSAANFKLSPAPIGALAVLIGSLLDWISIPGFSGNAFRVPMQFLIDYKTTGGGLKVGLLLVAAAVVAGVFCVLPGRVKVRRILGGVVIFIALVYCFQLHRVLSSGGSAAPSLFSAIGKLGLLFTIAGGVALIVDTSEPEGSY